MQCQRFYFKRGVASIYVEPQRGSPTTGICTPCDILYRQKYSISPLAGEEVAVIHWSRDEAVALCVKIEAICPAFGCHVALTGGCLYRDGLRKDCDILLYRIRQAEGIDLDGLWKALKESGVELVSGFGWLYKLTYQGRAIDCFLPEEQENAQGYDSTEDEISEPVHFKEFSGTMF